MCPVVGYLFYLLRYACVMLTCVKIVKQSRRAHNRTGDPGLVGVGISGVRDLGTVGLAGPLW